MKNNTPIWLGKKLFFLIFLFLVCLFCVTTVVLAATNNWDFSNSSDYNFDNTKIEFSSGKAQTKAGANWYDVSWTRRKPITITGSTGGAQTDYPLKITVAYDSDMQSDFDDIRFAGSNGTQLNYWLETKTDSTSAVYWVKIPSIPASPSTATIYLYYSNISATSTSNGDNVFSFFDDFSSGTAIPDIHASTLINTSSYDYFGIILNSNTNELMEITRQGSSHIDITGKIVKATYNTLTDTWSSYSTVYDSVYDDRNVGGGKLGSDIFSFFARHDGSNWVDLGYVKSSDNGSSWSSYTPINVGLTNFSPYGHIIQVGSTYYQVYYGDDGASHYEVKLFKTTDNGNSWSVGPTIYSGSTSYTETEVVNIGSNKLVALMRRDSPTGGGSNNRLFQATSSDGGLSWSSVTDTNLGSGTNSVVPAGYYDSETDEVIALYADRTDKTIRIAKADANTVFNDSTKYRSETIVMGASVDIAYPSMTKISNNNYYLTWGYEVSGSDTDLYGGRFSFGSKWSNAQDSASSISGGAITIDDDWIKSNNLIAGTNNAIRARAKMSGTNVKQILGYSDNWDNSEGDIANSPNSLALYFYSDGNIYPSVNDGSVNQVTSSAYDSSYHTYDIIRNGTTEAQFKRDNINLTNTPIVSNVPSQSMYIHLEDYNNSTGSAEYDWILSRKYISPEPTDTTGSESMVYDTSNPAIYPTTYQSFTALSGFSESATKNGGEIKYQLSNNNGSTWYWYNSGWTTTSGGYSEATTSSTINSNIATLPIGSGQFLFKAYLHSDGTQLIQLDNVALTYLNDTSPPTGSISVNSGSLYTTTTAVTLTISVSDDTDSSSSIQMQVSNDSGFSGASWVSYATTQPWVLSAGEGTKTVYIRFRDSTNNISGSYSDSIVYDNSAPGSPGNLNVENINTSTQTWSWTSASDAASGIANYTYRVLDSLNNTIASGSTSDLFVITNLSNGAYTFFVKATDNVGNESSEVSNSAVVSILENANSDKTENTCDEDKPKGVVRLYSAVPENSKSITLYFTKGEDPIDHYELKYGTKSENYEYSKENIGLRGTKSYTLKLLNPNTNYYFRIRSIHGCAKGKWSNEIQSKTKSLTDLAYSSITSNIIDMADKADIVESVDNKNNTSGNQPQAEKNNAAKESNPSNRNSGINAITYTVKIKVLDTDKNPVKDAKVTLHSTPREAKTDENGVATFNDVEGGQHSVFIAYNGYTGEQNINLSGEIKTFDITVNITKGNPFSDIYVMAILGGLVLIIIILISFLLLKKLNK